MRGRSWKHAVVRFTGRGKAQRGTVDRAGERREAAREVGDELAVTDGSAAARWEAAVRIHEAWASVLGCYDPGCEYGCGREM